MGQHIVAVGTTDPNEVRRWRSDGETDVWEDSLWEEGIAFWGIFNSGGAEAESMGVSKE